MPDVTPSTNDWDARVSLDKVNNQFEQIFTAMPMPFVRMVVALPLEETVQGFNPIWKHSAVCALRYTSCLCASSQ